MVLRKEGLPKRERLRGSEAFRRVYDQGDAHRGAHLVVIVYRAPELDHRVGFVTSRKVGSAVVRNRARRLMRESYRRLKVQMPEGGRHVHMVFVARHSLPDAGFSATYEDMRKLMIRAGVLDDSIGEGREA